MNVFIDCFYDPDSGDPWSLHLEDTTWPKIWETMRYMINEAPQKTTYDVDYFEIWDGSVDEPNEPIKSLSPQEVDEYFTTGLGNCKSIW